MPRQVRIEYEGAPGEETSLDETEMQEVGGTFKEACAREDGRGGV